jgi:pimeloyl-ACP methyl ester carboxylesterase
MTLLRLFRSILDTPCGAPYFRKRFFALLLLSVGLTGVQRSFPAETAKSSKRFQASSTLPLTSFYDTPHPLPAGKPGELIRSEPINQYSLPYELSAWRIVYHSRTLGGEDVAVSGVVLIPDGKPPAGGWPVIAWAHEFRGEARQCAPSLIRNLGVGPLLAMYANLGYAVVATDYAGLGADSAKPVTDMESNALDVIYSVSAARAAIKEIGPKWIAIGAFQGAMAAVAIAESDSRDPGYLGSVATSGLADAQPAYERYAGGASARMLLVLASSIKALHPEFQLSDMLKDEAIRQYQRAAPVCGGMGPEFTSEMLKAGWENTRFVKEFFASNTSGQEAAHGPLLVISGKIDPVIPADMTANTVARMCKHGGRVLFLKYPGVDTSGVMAASAADQISWIKARFAGRAAPGNCH